MFDNLIESINAQLPFTDELKKKLSSVVGTPDLSFFGNNQSSQSSSNETKRLPTLELDKASLLRLLRTCYLCPKDNKNYSECKKVNDAIIQKNSLSKILTQLSDFQFIVGVETIIALQTRNNDATIGDEEYQTRLVKAANNAPKHLRPLYGFAMLQLLGLRNLYKKPQDHIKKLPESAKEVLTRKVFLPVLFAGSLEIEESAITLRILKEYDIFGMILHKWIESMSKVFLPEVKQICFKEIFYLLSRFLRLYSKSLISQSPATISTRVLPLMSQVVNRYHKLFTKFLADCNIFMKNLVDNRFGSVLLFLSCSCNSKENALKILQHFTNCQNRAEPLINQFFEALKEAHNEIVSETVSNCSKSALYLLKNLFKYLPDAFKEQIILMFHNSELNTPQACLAEFLWNFMSNNELAPSAAKCLNHLSALYPETVYRFFNDPDSFNNIESMMDYNSKITRSFVKIARNIISFSFCRDSTITISVTSSGIPLFAKFLVTDYFTRSLFKKFDRRSKRWSTLTSLLEAALDITYCDYEFCSELPNNQDFVRGLISIVHQTTSILSQPPTVIQESDTVRIDSDNLRYIIQFDCIAMNLMIRLITYNLMDINGLNQKLSYMCTSFFGDNNSDAYSLFTTFVSFLEFTHPLSSQLRYYSVKMLDLMCEIAGRLPSTNVDSFYPHESQKVLKELISTNLFKSNDVSQITTQLDFLTHTLSSQLPFAYSFIHRLGSSYIIAAASRLESVADEFPDWLLSISRILSKMFQKLSTESTIITKISSDQKFLSSIWGIIKMDLPENGTIEDKCNLIASKAELLNVAILMNSKIDKEIIGILFTQMKSILPTKFEQIIVDCKLDINRFIAIELHRIYGKDFYLDTDLLRRYLVDKDSVVKSAQQLNESLSIIDACTQLMSTIVNLLKTTSDENLIPPVKDSLRLLINVLKNNIYPDSTVGVFFDLVDVCLSCISSPINTVDPALLRAITYYMNKRPIDSTFLIISKFISSSDIENKEELLLMLEPCIKFSQDSVKNGTNSSNALKCASEIALKLSTWDNWIIKSPICAECFFTLLPTPLGCAVVDFMTLILLNKENSTTLEQSGFFDQLTEIDFLDSDARSPVWPHLFNMITAIPLSLKAPYVFVTTHLNHIEFYLNENPAVFAKQINVFSTIPFERGVNIANSNTISIVAILTLFKIQLSIMQLLARVAPYLSKNIDCVDPIQHEMLLDIVSNKLRKAVLFLSEASQLKINKGGFNKYDVDTYNEKTCNLLILRYCLIFFNSQFEFGSGTVPIITNKAQSTSSNPILDLMVKVAEVLKEILLNDAGIFNDVCIESFEYALRIYLSALKIERNQIMETKNSILRSISSVKSSIKKYNIDAQESFQLFDAANDYIANII